MFLTLIPYIFSTFALLLTAYLVYRAESREDVKGVDARLAKLEISQSSQEAYNASIQAANAKIARLEVESANHTVRQQGFQAEIEGVADTGFRERAAIVENVRREHEVLRDLIKDIPNMRDLLNRMVERFEYMTKAMDKTDGKMDRIVELLTRNK